MYQIKQKPDDFIVKEIPDYNLDESGNYAYFWLTKKNYTTVDAVKRIADKLNIISKRIGFAGSKDKIAVTKQVISLKDKKKEQVEKIKLAGIKLDYIGQGKTPISLGDLKGNEFVITIRDLSPKEIKKAEGVGRAGLIKIPNLFGPQRFSKNNAEIGKALVKRNFSKAVELIDQKQVKHYIEDNPADFIGALRQIPLKTRKIYIHAYQSLIWNKTAEQFLKTNPYKNLKIPIIGFGTDIETIDYNLKEIILDILNKEQITERDFILKEIKELSSEGAERDLFITPENFHIQIKETRKEQSSFVSQKPKVSENTAIITFNLPKGSYATVVIEFIFQ